MVNHMHSERNNNTIVDSEWKMNLPTVGLSPAHLRRDRVSPLPAAAARGFLFKRFIPTSSGYTTMPALGGT